MAPPAATLSLTDYDAIGFDVDHTLARYNLPHTINVLFNGIVNFLKNDWDWDDALVKPFDVNKDFCARGLIYDIKLGNFLKLSHDGCISKCSHGTRFLSREEICTVYGSDYHSTLADQIKNKVDNLGDESGCNFAMMDNFYDSMGGAILSRMVDICDKNVIKNGGRVEDVHSYRYIWEDVMAGYGHMYWWKAYQDDTGGFFPAYKRDPEKFIYPCSAGVLQWFRELRAAGIKLFIMTSSAADFAQQTMKVLFGCDWCEYFDLVITRAGKPRFFFKDTKFVKVDGTVDGAAVDVIEKGQIYSQGNLDDFMGFLKTETGKEDPRVLYFGDSLRSDIFPAKHYAGWDTAFILEEIRGEKLREHNGEETTSAENTNDVSDLECQYLTSHQWGSYFTNDVTKGGGVSSLWSDVIKKYADIALPTLQHITDYPINHKFSRFNENDQSSSGFHPDPPSILQNSH